MKDYISIIIYLSAMVYFYIGTTVLSLNNKSIQNRIFFVLSLAAVYWSFTFSVANSAQTYEIALLWRRLSSLGWGFFFSLLLNFTFIFTSKAFLMKNKWLLFFIYLPSVINVWVFGIYEPIVLKQYNLLEGVYGWYHVTENTAWEVYFRVYYSLFVAISLFLFIRWDWKEKNKRTRRTGCYIGGGILLGFLLGTLTNFLLNYAYGIAIPQLEPIFSLIPMLILFTTVDEFGLKAKSVYQEYVKGQFLSKETHEKLLVMIARIYILTAFVVFAFRYFSDHWTLTRIFPATFFLFGIGATILILISINNMTNVVDRILKIVLIISIPTISVIVFDTIGIYGLAGPAVMILLSSTYNDFRLTRNVIIMTFLTFFCIWLIQPVSVVRYESIDHLGRLIIFGMIGWVATFMNKVYTQRLNQVERQIEIETFLRNYTRMLADIERDNIEDKSPAVLELFGSLYQLQGLALIFRLGSEIKEYSLSKAKDTGRELEDMVSEIKFRMEYKALSPDGKEMNTGKVIINHKLISDRAEIYWLMDNLNVLGAFALFHDNKEELEDLSKANAMDYFVDRLAASIIKINSEDIIHKMVHIDEVTGFHSRYALNKHMKDLIDMRQEFSFVLVSVDNLHVYNETLGYQQGDVLLRSFTEAIDQTIELEHFVARFYSEIFGIVIMNCMNEATIVQTMEKALAHTCHKLSVLNLPVELELSVGISC